MISQRTAFTIVVLSAVYAIAGFLLYRARVTSPAAIWASDFLVFVAPAVLAFAAVVLVVSQDATGDSRNGKQWRRGALIALVAVLVSWCAYMIVAAKVFGT